MTNNKKFVKIKENMKGNLNFSNGNAFLIEDRLERRYFFGKDIAEGCMLLADEKVYFLDSRYYYEFEAETVKAGFKPVLYQGVDTIREYCAIHNVKSLKMNFDNTTVSRYNELSLYFSVSDGKDEINACRMVKSKKEIEYIEKACEIAWQGFNKSLGAIREGVTELKVKSEIEKNCLSLGAEEMSFDTIVAFGKNSAVPHHESDKTKLQKNMPVLIDMGCKYNGYCSDLTRTLYFGTPDKKFMEAYYAVKTANESVIVSFNAGAQAKDLHNMAEYTINKFNFKGKFTHSLGHGVGLEIHEEPRISYKSKTTLKDNMVFTVEPGVYLDGEFGVRIEDTVVINKDGIKRLFSDDKELIIIK